MVSGRRLLDGSCHNKLAEEINYKLPNK